MAKRKRRGGCVATPICLNLGPFFRKARKANGVTVNDIATFLGIHFTTVQKREHGLLPIADKDIGLVCRAYKLTDAQLEEVRQIIPPDELEFCDFVAEDSFIVTARQRTANFIRLSQKVADKVGYAHTVNVLPFVKAIVAADIKELDYRELLELVVTSIDIGELHLEITPDIVEQVVGKFRSG